jgi:hypothetical protein
MEKSILEITSLSKDLEGEVFSKGVDRFKEILALSTNVISSAQKVSDSKYSYYLNILLNKFLDHTVSLFTIINDIKKEEDTCYFISSTHLLSRAQFEVYLMLIYLFFENESHQEKDLKFLIYEFSGLKQRQKNKPNQSHLLSKYEDEKKRTEELEELIKNNIIFEKFGRDKRKNILKGDSSKITSSTSIIKNSSFLKNNVFEKLWTLQSNYAHSEYISVIQLHFYLNNRLEATKTIKNSLRTVSVVCGALSFDLLDNCSESKEAAIKLTNYQNNILQFYKGVATTAPPLFIPSK